MMPINTMPEGVKVGVTGIDRISSGIITLLLTSGHQVVAVVEEGGHPELRRRVSALLDVHAHLMHLHNPVPWYLSRLTVGSDYQMLLRCGLVLECAADDLQHKAGIYQEITQVVQRTTVIASIASTIAISALQHIVDGPERFFGLSYTVADHLEITCGELTEQRYAQWLYQLALQWGKKPALLRRDISGNVTSRLIYANYREVIHPGNANQPAIVAIRPQKKAV